MFTYLLLILGVFKFSDSFSSKWLNNDLLVNKNKPIIFVPGLGGSIIYDSNNIQIWPPSLFTFLRSNHYQKQLLIKNTLEPLYFTKTASLININKNGNDKDGIKIISGAITNLITNKFGEHILEFFYDKSYPVYAFPYDFRIIPNTSYMFELNRSMKESIEYIYNENSEKKIIIITHSLGSLLMMDFFNSNSKEWNEKYIDTVICINPPFDGSILALKIFFIDTLNLYFREINLDWIKNFGGLIWCLPKLEQNSNILNIDGKDIENIINYLPEETREIYNKYFLNNKTKINKDINLHIINSFGENTPSKLYLKKVKNSYIFDKYDYIDSDGVILNDYIQDTSLKIHKIIGEHSNILTSKILLDKIHKIVK